MFTGSQFPDYVFEDTQIDTWFGADHHAKLKADLSGRRIYTYGGTDATVHVYDTQARELVEILRMLVPEGAEITALTCSPDGALLYVAASVRGTDTVLGIAQTGDKHSFERPMQILCDITITDMAITEDDPGLIYAVGLARGLFQLRPDVLAAEEQPKPEPIWRFNAVGHMAVDSLNKRIFCTAAPGVDDGVPNVVSEIYDRIAICEMGADAPRFAPELPLAFLSENDNTGRDDIALRTQQGGSRIYLVVDPIKGGSDKVIATFDIPANSVTGILQAELAVQDTMIALAFEADRDTLYASFADSFRLQAISGDGVSVKQARVPVQFGPTDVAIGPKGDIFTANDMSSTVTAIPADEVEDADNRLAPLANMRWQILMAFYALVGNLFQYLKDCFCHHLLLKCPECDGDEKIYIACVDIRAQEDGTSQIHNICNFGKRKYVQTFMGWNYWLSLVPVIPLMKQAIARMCCTVLPNFMEQAGIRTIGNLAARRALIARAKARLQ